MQILSGSSLVCYFPTWYRWPTGFHLFHFILFLQNKQMLTLSWAHMKLYRNIDELLEMQTLFGLLIKIANIKKKAKTLSVK